MNHSYHSYRRVDTTRLKDSIDSIDFYTHEGQEINTRGKTDWKLGGLCPFHADRNAGSFYINSKCGAFRCFSCGTSGGDVIAFVQKKYEMRFNDAVKKLVNEWRII